MVAIAARISFRVGDVSLDGAQMRVNCGLAVVLFQTFVTLLVSDGVFFFFVSPPPAGLLRRSDVLFAVTSGMSRW